MQVSKIHVSIKWGEESVKICLKEKAPFYCVLVKTYTIFTDFIYLAFWIIVVQFCSFNCQIADMMDTKQIADVSGDVSLIDTAAKNFDKILRHPLFVEHETQARSWKQETPSCHVSRHKNRGVINYLAKNT